MTNAGADSLQEDFERLLETAAALPLKLRLRLLDALKDASVLEREDGLRFRLESFVEYKRARRPPGQHGPLVRWIESFGPHDVFYDIGANTGALSLVAARVGRGKVPVYAIEPAFDSFAALARNISANGFGDVVIPLQVALSDRTSLQQFHRASLGAGTALHALGTPIDYARNPFTPAATEHVLAFSLDDLVRVMGLPKPTRVKLDVDGLEDRVLAGGATVLTSGPCQVFVEVVDAVDGDPHPEQLVDFLEGLGYTVADRLEHTAAGEYPRVSDVLFVRE